MNKTFLLIMALVVAFIADYLIKSALRGFLPELQINLFIDGLSLYGISVLFSSWLVTRGDSHV